MKILNKKPKTAMKTGKKLKAKTKRQKGKVFFCFTE